MTKSTLYGVTPAHLEKIRELALTLGYPAKRGPSQGSGSASALIRAIAEGEVIIVKKKGDQK